MSQENVEIVRGGYETWRRTRQLEIDLLDPDVEWTPDRRVGEGPIRGREKVIEFFTDMASMFDQLDYEIEQVWDHNDQVLVFLWLTGSGAASGAGFDIHIAHLWTLRDGMLVRGEGFADRSEALEAAGLRE
jgi:uncharacterized protein